MARHIWSVLCQSVLIDTFTNSMSFIQTIEGLSFPRAPAAAPQMMVGTLWVRTGNELQVLSRIRILDPSGKQVTVIENRPADLSTVRSRSVTILGGFPLNIAGTYSVVIEAKQGGSWAEAAVIPLEISFVNATDLAALMEQRAEAASTRAPR